MRRAAGGPSRALGGPSKPIAAAAGSSSGKSLAAGSGKVVTGKSPPGSGRGVHVKTGGGGKAKPYSRAEPIATGEFLTDLPGKRWRIGKSIGVGGFGEIYLASDEVSKPVTEKTASYVVKIEPYLNGPLFCEIAVYLRMARLEMVEEWKKSHKMDCLGMPHYVASGSHEYNNQKYRFLVLPRYGQDLHKILESKPAKRLSSRCVQAIALQIIDTLEYIHSKEYIHGDIKASNLLLGLEKKQHLYLLDYGLGSKFVDKSGVHEVYGPDARRAHNGTLEYTSRDAHIGAFSRRGDLEILGYNMLEWLTGKLPWSGSDTPVNVSKQKVAFMKSVQLNRIYPSDIIGLDVCEKYLRYVASLGFDQEPNYNHCREILKRGLPNKSTSLYFEDSVVPSPKKRKTSPAVKTPDSTDGEEEVVTKKIRVPEDEDVKRATRTTKKVKNFNWARVLSSNPEEIIRSAAQPTASPTASTELKLNHNITNPTPAMLQILTKRKENVHSNLAMRTNSASDLQEITSSGPSKLTDAMKDILMRTKKKKLRKSISDSNLQTIPLKITTKPVFRPPANPGPMSSTLTAASSSSPAVSSRHARHLRRNK